MRSGFLGAVALVACSTTSGGGGTTAAIDEPVGALGLNDVSVLLPLPKTSAEADLLIKPSDVGAKGQMLPDWVAPGPALVQSEDRQTTLAALRVVATRIDPCWPNIGERELDKCERALHVIWQPIVAAWEKDAATMAAADAAVHTFHRLTRREFDDLLEELLALEATAPVDAKLPLQVHPTISAQGLGGAFFAAYKGIVQKYAGGDNVFEMTFLSLRANATNNLYLGNGWLLSGLNFGDGQSSRVSVATTSDNEEHFGNNASEAIEDATTFLGDFTPASKNTTALLSIVGDSKAAMTAPIADIQAAVDVALKAENPLMSTLDSVECMTCHVGTTARVWAEKNRGIDTSKNPNRYTSASFDLTLVSDTATRTNAIHGLGWYGTHMAITQRTVNDTAAGADFVNAKLLRRP